MIPIFVSFLLFSSFSFFCSKKDLSTNLINTVFEDNTTSLGPSMQKGVVSKIERLAVSPTSLSHKSPASRTVSQPSHKEEAG